MRNPESLDPKAQLMIGMLQPGEAMLHVMEQSRSWRFLLRTLNICWGFLFFLYMRDTGAYAKKL